MQRDFDLLREILLLVEAGETPAEIPGYTEDQVLYHIVLGIEAGLLIGQYRHRPGGRVAVAIAQRLTWHGHDFLDACRPPSRWEKAKALLVKSGGSFTFDVVKSVLVKLATQSVTCLSE